MYAKVLEFRTKLGLEVADEPTLLSPDQMSFYARFCLEELSELMSAHEQKDLVEAADAVVDLIYVMLGCAHHMGLPLEELFDAVHACNMTKTPGATKRYGLGQDAVKPPGWVGPNVAIGDILCNHRLDET